MNTLNRLWFTLFVYIDTEKTKPKINKFINVQYLYFLQVALPRRIRIPLSADLKITVHELCFKK